MKAIVRPIALIMACFYGVTEQPAVANTGTDAEAKTAAYFDSITGSKPRLRIFLQMMPKGGDLHNHGGGVNYAEDMLDWAAQSGLCIATDTLAIVDGDCATANRIPAAGLDRKYDMYSRVIDRLSTRGFEEGIGDPTQSGYNRFFSTFEAFWIAVERNQGKALAAAKEQAAANKVSYLELGSGARATSMIVSRMGALNGEDFPAALASVASHIPAAVAAAKKEHDAAESAAKAIDGCVTASPKPACAVDVRYHFTIIRTDQPADVFAQMAFGFALVDADPRFVAINIAAPEHDPIAVRDYSLHMRMLAFFKARYPKVPMSLHAGELTLGLVAPRALRSHIREAIEVAGANRIGHGIDISYESDAIGLLKNMADKQIAVEINLTSNAVILGVKGSDHPLSLYREAGVPVVLSTDDEGVSRSDMTNEYLRGVTEQQLQYRDLKGMARNSLHYSFLDGQSLWLDAVGGAIRPSCSIPTSASCTAFLANSEKARMQLRLEQDFVAFEARYQ